MLTLIATMFFGKMGMKENEEDFTDPNYIVSIKCHECKATVYSDQPLFCYQDQQFHKCCLQLFLKKKKNKK